MLMIWFDGVGGGCVGDGFHVTSECWIPHERVLATVLSSPRMCRKSVVNSEMYASCLLTLGEILSPLYIMASISGL